MLFRRRSEPKPSEALKAASRLPANAELRGQLGGLGDLAIDGHLVGDVEARGEVVVSAGACVEGAVRARVVRVAGRVLGPVRGTERIEILAGGSIEGDLESPHVVVVDGADLHGKVDVRN